MVAQKSSQPQGSIWRDENISRILRLRVKTFYNADYFERVVLPLLDLPPAARVLDVGCGNGGLSFTLARLRPDLQITGIDPEANALESAAQAAAENGWVLLRFEQGDAHQLTYEDSCFDMVMCQTVLTHVRDAEKVIIEMTRVLKPGGVFFAAEYTETGFDPLYCSIGDEMRDEAWCQEYIRLSRLYMQGKITQGRGDDRLGIRIPYMASKAGLDVFDVRLNDRVLHVIPPYTHSKQRDYLELVKEFFAPDQDSTGLERVIGTIEAAGGTEAEALWLYKAESDAAVRQAIENRALTRVSAYMLFLTFARKPVTL